MYHSSFFSPSSQQHRGFFLIEVVVVCSIIAGVLIFLMSTVQDSVEVSQRSLERTQAAYLLEEGMEAVKSIRNQNWATIDSQLTETPLYLSWSGASWTLSSSPNTIDGFFTRTIVFSNVVRDSNDDIATTGTADEGTKRATVTVTWNVPSGAKTETLSFYLTDI